MVTAVLAFLVGEVDEPQSEDAWTELYEWLGEKHRMRLPKVEHGEEEEDKHWHAWSQDQADFRNYYIMWQRCQVQPARKSSSPAEGGQK